MMMKIIMMGWFVGGGNDGYENYLVFRAFTDQHNSIC